MQNEREYFKSHRGWGIYHPELIKKMTKEKGEQPESKNPEVKPDDSGAIKFEDLIATQKGQRIRRRNDARRLAQEAAENPVLTSRSSTAQEFTPRQEKQPQVTLSIAKPMADVVLEPGAKPVSKQKPKSVGRKPSAGKAVGHGILAGVALGAANLAANNPVGEAISNINSSQEVRDEASIEPVPANSAEQTIEPQATNAEVFPFEATLEPTAPSTPTEEPIPAEVRELMDAIETKNQELVESQSGEGYSSPVWRFPNTLGQGENKIDLSGISGNIRDNWPETEQRANDIETVGNVFDRIRFLAWLGSVPASQDAPYGWNNGELANFANERRNSPPTSFEEWRSATLNGQTDNNIWVSSNDGGVVNYENQSSNVWREVDIANANVDVVYTQGPLSLGRQVDTGDVWSRITVTVDSDGQATITLTTGMSGTFLNRLVPRFSIGSETDDVFYDVLLWGARQLSSPETQVLSDTSRDEYLRMDNMSNDFGSAIIDQALQAFRLHNQKPALSVSTDNN